MRDGVLPGRSRAAGHQHREVACQQGVRGQRSEGGLGEGEREFAQDSPHIPFIRQTKEVHARSSMALFEHTSARAIFPSPRFSFFNKTRGEKLERASRHTTVRAKKTP